MEKNCLNCGKKLAKVYGIPKKDKKLFISTKGFDFCNKMCYKEWYEFSGYNFAKPDPSAIIHSCKCGRVKEWQPEWMKNVVMGCKDCWDTTCQGSYG